MGTYIRLVDYETPEAKEKGFSETNNRFSISETLFYEVPGFPFAYWISGNLRKSFQNKLLSDIGESYQGIITGKVDYFLKQWYEINFNRITFGEHDYRVLEMSDTFYPYVKGGGFRKWFGNFNYIIKWSDNGTNLVRSRTENRDKFLKEEITWSLISTSDSAFRFVPNGFLSDVSGSCYIPNDKEDLLYVLGFLNSKISTVLLRVINPTININVRDILMMPLKKANDISISKLVEENVKVCQDDWNDYETSWEFKKHPLI